MSVPNHEGDIPVARRTDPETSHEAARSVGHVRQSQRRVMQIVKAMGGEATDTEIAEAARFQRWAISPSGLRTRRSELVTKGLLVDSGKTRLTPSNRRTIVWKVAG